MNGSINIYTNIDEYLSLRENIYIKTRETIRFFSEVNRRATSFSKCFKRSACRRNAYAWHDIRHMQRKWHREYRSERGHCYSLFSKTVISMVVESGTLDTATSLRTGNLCIESVCTYQNIGGNEELRQQKAIFKGSGDNEPESIVKQVLGSYNSSLKNIDFHAPSVYAGLPSKASARPHTMNSVSINIPAAFNALNCSTVSIYMTEGPCHL